ncbi:NAD(P)/FAD-dependent oxidoreductase [Egicoccus sp. AB-alg2]|uniref:protoporphyrinogen/coproporphyrinogen oxidase n=1 Tax=Egicoccus sp. AB-alg2 TaxID=3242693 RepID=UPI00359EF727
MSRVLVVGAGLAGLTCAVRLSEAGADVEVLEADDGVGGRVRTDVVDGFRVDRGFQVLLTGYPAARRWFDYAALELRPFSPGVTIRRAGRFERLVDPLQDPVAALRSLPRVRLGPRDALRLVAWRHDLLATPGRELADRRPLTTRDLLRRRGFSDALVERFFRPFLTGTFFDAELTTSSRMTELVFRSFFRGEVAVPDGGMQRLPEQLAARLPAGTVRLSTRVDGVGDGEVTLADGSTRAADHVVVAVDGPTAAALLGERLARAPAPGRGNVTLWYAADRSPVDAPDLVLAADDDGPVNNVAAMSDVAPGYAPPGRTCLAVSLRGYPRDDDATLDAAVRAQLRGWYGSQVDGWQPLAVHRVPYAQPRQDLPDLDVLARESRAGERTWVCGDHLDTASIQGALVSGRRAADAVLAA